MASASGPGRITDYIPHRPPFLLLDTVLELGVDSIRAQTTLRPDDQPWASIYPGHYPDNPITPGVLLLEIIFQAAAVLAADIVGRENLKGTPVVTRIQNAKFRNMVFPGDTVEVAATLTERAANAFFMKGSMKKDGKEALRCEFAVALADKPPEASA